MDPTSFPAALETDNLVLDGGLATELEAQGADLSDALWSARILADDPDRIISAHLAYYRAGARVATTASYQATFEGFARRGIGREAAAALMRRSVELAADARAGVYGERRDEPASGVRDDLFVAGSIGPYGAMLADGSEYRGRYGLSVAQLRDFHRDRLAVLAGTPADVLAVETIPELDEAVAVVELLGEIEAAAWVSFSCADGRRLRSGAPIEEAVAAIDGASGVVAIGVNCTAPAHIEELVTRIRTATALPIIAYPNSGEGWNAARKAWTGAPGGRVDAAAARRWLAAGARAIGGCCRVTPEQVRGLAEGLRASA